ncbi:S16 family serine protease [Prosthecobacter sp.]|uniref:S16 family serine protease n=1 Tax=Prosthecobacter sp. TaxID=1965333 RepID=UPI0037850A64
MRVFPSVSFAILLLASALMPACKEQGKSSGSSSAIAASDHFEIDFDAVFEWKKPCVMNAEELEAKLDKIGPTTGKKWFALDASSQFSQPSQLFNSSYRETHKLKYSIFCSNEVEPQSVRVMWADGQISYVAVRYTAQKGETEAAPSLLASIGEALGAPPFSRNSKGYTWDSEHYSASATFTLAQGDTIFFVVVHPKKAGVTPAAAKPSGSVSESSVSTMPKPASPPASTLDLLINLDDLIDWKKPLSMSREEFEKKLKALEKIPGRKPYFLDSGTAESSHVFNPDSISAYKLSFSMLKGSRSPVSMRVEWKDNRASRINIIFPRQENEWDVAPEFIAQLDEAFVMTHKVSPTFHKGSSHSWQSPDFFASMSASPTQPRYFLSLYKPLAAVASNGTGRPASEIPTGLPASAPPSESARTEPKMPAASKVEFQPSSPLSPPARQTTAAFKLRLTQVNGLLISPLANGEESGHVTKMTLTALPNRGTQESWLEFNQDVGGSMRRALNEVSKLSQLRHDVWPVGYSLQIGFEDKYIEKDGPSAAVACALLVESALTGKKWDPAFAVTGDLNADGSVQPIGGVRAKIRGATNGSCKMVAVPAKNERAVADLLLLDGPAPLLGITVFGIKTFDDAMALASPERSEGLKLALADFDAMRTVMLRDPKQIMPLLRTQHAAARLQALLFVAPDCYSAKYLLLHAQGRSARTLSLGGSIEAAQSSAQAIVNSIDNDVVTAMSSLKPDEVGTSLNKLRSLRPILDQRVWPYVDAVTDYGDVIRSAILNPVRSGARYVDLVTKAKKAAGSATSALNILMNNAQVREELGL